MAEIKWDQTGQRFYETGTDHGVLYLPDNTGAYVTGVAWNGLTAITEAPSGAETTKLYADNIAYANMQSAEEFGGTIEAYTYPDEFEECDGSRNLGDGVSIGQQPRRSFGLSYRTLVGNDIAGTAYGYKLHLVYGCLAAPSEKSYATVNDSPEAVTFSWEFSTTPVPVEGHAPTAVLTINSAKVDPDALEALEQILYGTASTDPRLPNPDEVAALLDGAITVVTATQPTYNPTTDVVTIPSTPGVNYYIDGELVTGTVTITKTTVVSARPAPGYVFSPTSDDDWTIAYS